MDRKLTEIKRCEEDVVIIGKAMAFKSTGLCEEAAGAVNSEITTKKR